MREKLLEEQLEECDYYCDNYPSTNRQDVMDRIYKNSKKIMDKVDENDRRKKTIRNPVPKVKVEEEIDFILPNVKGVIPILPGHIKFSENPMEIL